MESPVDRRFDRARAARSRRAYWRLVEDLQGIGSREVFVRARSRLESPDPDDRRLGADVLGELGFQETPRPFRDRSIGPLKRALARETDPPALAAMVRALSRLNARSAIRSLVRLVRHPSAEVRFALAAELASCTWDTGEEVPDGRVTETLLALSADRDCEVRDWATFSLAGSDVDGLGVRAALWRRVKDRHLDTRIEGLRGLALRRDPDIHELVRGAVFKAGRRGLGSWTVDDFVDYAKAAGDADLVRALEALEPARRSGRTAAERATR